MPRATPPSPSSPSASSPTIMSSDSGWSIISAREQEKDTARQKQTMLYEQAQAASSVANLTARRLGTSRTHYQIEDPQARLPPPPLVKEFPRTTSEEKFEREPSKGTSFTRKIKTSLLGGKNPFASSSKAAEREKDNQEPIVIPPPLSPEPDAVLVPRPGSESNELPAPSRPSRTYRPPPVTSYPRLYSGQPSQPPQSQPQSQPQPNPNPRRGSFTTPTRTSEPNAEPAKIERPPSRSRSRDVSIIEAPSKQVSNEREPVLGALQSHRGAPRKTAPGPLSSEPTPLGRPLPRTPASISDPPPPSTSRSRPAADPPAKVVVTPVPQPARPAPESLHPGAHYRDSPSSQPTSSSPPVVRYKRSSDRTSYGTTATTPSLSSSVRTHASQATSDVPPKDMERINWAAAPPKRAATTDHVRAASVDQANAVDVWEQSMAQLSLRSNEQAGYHMEMSSKYKAVQSSPPPLIQPADPKPKKLQRYATTTASTPIVTHYYYDPSPPLISRITRLSDLKEDYRNPGSERSDIIRRKINYLRFELGYTGLRRARGDGNCFYRSFAFAYLEQICFAEDRALAVLNALDHLEVAQNLVDVAIPENRFSQRMHLFLRDIIRNMELGTMDQRKLLQTFQNQRDSDDIVAYVRILASAYIRLTPEMHASVFHPDDPSTVISPPDFCSIYVEQLGQDADHLQISALSRTLNVSVYIYRLDEKVDGTAPNSQDIVAHCTRFIPTDAPVVTEPVTLLFRPGHYDVLERHTNQQ